MQLSRPPSSLRKAVGVAEGGRRATAISRRLALASILLGGAAGCDPSTPVLSKDVMPSSDLPELLRGACAPATTEADCDPSVLARGKDMIAIRALPEPLMLACAPDKTKADCAAVAGLVAGNENPDLVQKVRDTMAQIRAEEGSLESVNVEVYMPPEPEEDRPGVAIGVATFGVRKIRFQIWWGKIDGNLVLSKWNMTKL